MNRFLLLAILPLLAACATPSSPSYGPSNLNASGVGYDDVRIENDRWRVSYTADGRGAELDAERLVLRRAADLAQRAGYEWFEIVDRRISTEGEGRSPVRVGGSVSQTFGSRRYSGTGVGIGISISPGAKPTSTATIEIIAGSGTPIPQEAYDVAALLQSGGY